MTNDATQQSSKGGTSVLDNPSITDSGDGIYAHYVRSKNGKSADQRITEAVFHGTPIKAICGFEWVPCRDPSNKLICPPCKSLYDSGKRND